MNVRTNCRSTAQLTWDGVDGSDLTCDYVPRKIVPPIGGFMHRPRPRIPATLSESIHRQLNMYARAASTADMSSLSLGQPTEGKSDSLHCRLRPCALAATAVGLLGLVQLGEGKIVYTPASSQVRSQLRIDLNHDGVTDFYLFYFPPSCQHSNRRSSHREPWGRPGIAGQSAGRDEVLRRRVGLGSRGW